MRPPAEWSLWEARWRGKGYCTEALADEPVGDLVVVYSQLRLLVAGGVPSKRELGNPKYQQWGKMRVHGSKLTVPLYVSKPNRSHWRLYFIAVQDHRRIIVLYAVKKKENPRDPADFGRCQHIFDQISGDDARGDIDRLHLPPG
jgi:hypothetical protein